MSASLPDPNDVQVEDLQQLIENLPDEKRQQLLSQLDMGTMGNMDAGDIGRGGDSDNIGL